MFFLIQNMIKHDPKEIVALSLLKEYILSAENFVFEVSSDYCMKPFLLNGDQILVKKISVKNLSLGDMIVCQTENYFYIHRFLYKYSLHKDKKSGRDGLCVLISKPDKGIYCDRPILQDKLIGKAVMIKRKNKEIYLEGAFWSKINYVAGTISLFQVYVYKVLRFIKRVLWKNKAIPFAEPVKRVLVSPLRAVILFLHLFSA